MDATRDPYDRIPNPNYGTLVCLEVVRLGPLAGCLRSTHRRQNLTPSARGSPWNDSVVYESTKHHLTPHLASFVSTQQLDWATVPTRALLELLPLQAVTRARTVVVVN